MKKLTVLLAILFAVSSAFAATGAAGDPITAQASITVDVVCPITISVDQDLDYHVVAGTTYTGTSADVITFTIEGCTWGEEETNLAEINITYTLQPSVSNPDTKVAITGAWTIEGATVASPANNYAFDGLVPVVYTLATVVADADANNAVDYVWNLTVTAEYSAI